MVSTDDANQITNADDDVDDDIWAPENLEQQKPKSHCRVYEKGGWNVGYMKCFAQRSTKYKIKNTKSPVQIPKKKSEIQNHLVKG